MGISEMSADEVKEVMESMTPQARKMFRSLLLMSVSAVSAEPVRLIKRWLDMFEDDCAATVVAESIQRIGINIQEDMKKHAESSEERYNGNLASIIAIKELRGIADDIEKRLNHATCPNCDESSEKTPH